MSLAVEQYKPPDPFPVSALRAQGVVVFEAHDLADLLQQLELGIGDEAIERPRRVSFFNIKPHFSHKSLLTNHLASFILPPP